MIVCKFGGTSLKDGPAIRRAVNVVKEQRDRRPLVVLSAVAGTTNALLELGRVALSGETQTAMEQLFELASRHRWILFDLALGPEVERELADGIDRYREEISDYIRGVVLLRELTPRVQDAMTGYGERLSTLLFAAAARRQGLNVRSLDARDFIITDSSYTAARPLRALLEERSKALLEPLLEDGWVPVTQGYLGATRDGTPTTLGRGGSDTTASLLGAALGAEEIQIWTDVEGMLTADSRIVANSRTVRELSFAEAAELAYFGAKVLHPASIEPAMERNIPVRILCSARPDGGGTRIRASSPPSRKGVKSIAVKKGITVVHVQSLRMLMAHGFLKSMFEVFDRHRLAVDLVSTSEVSVSLTVDSIEGLSKVVEALSHFSKVTTEEDCAIVSLVGEALRHTPGVAARAFAALGDINVLMISQGASEINLSLVVREADAYEAVRRLHEELLAAPEDARAREPMEREAKP